MVTSPTEKLILFPDQLLRKNTELVTNLESISQFIADMFVVLKVSKGAGLSAPQIGKSIAVSIVQLTTRQLVLINPEYIKKSVETTEDFEGCLSLPGVYIKIPRHNNITISYLNMSGEIVQEEFADTEARIIQHEIDHLAGLLIIDFLSQIKKDVITRKLKKLKKKINKAEKEYPGAKSRTIRSINRLG